VQKQKNVTVAVLLAEVDPEIRTGG
jgi:hypothetical protein